MQIATIEGSDPEQFIIISVTDPPQAQSEMGNTPRRLSEDELRETLADSGMPAMDIEHAIAAARLNRVK